MAESGEEIHETVANNVIPTIPCIYKVPDWLKDHECDGNDRTPYEPDIISFGPYHRGSSKVKEMEKHKWRCLDIMLKRNQQCYEPYLTEMMLIEEVVRACYQGEYAKINSNEFAEMLVLDGCFMLEFLKGSKLGFINLDYKDDDPVFFKDAIKQVITRDMVKLENQIPLIVLEKLLSLQYKHPIKNKKHIPKLVLRVLNPLWITNQVLTDTELKIMRKNVTSNSDNMMLHCLDIFRSGLLYKPKPETSNWDNIAKKFNARVKQIFKRANIIQEEAPVNDTSGLGLESERDLEAAPPSSSILVSSDNTTIAPTSSFSNTRQNHLFGVQMSALCCWGNTIQTQAPVIDTSVLIQESQPGAGVDPRSPTPIHSDNPSTSIPPSTRANPIQTQAPVADVDRSSSTPVLSDNPSTSIRPITSDSFCPPDNSSSDEEWNRNNETVRQSTCLPNVVKWGQRTTEDESRVNSTMMVYCARELLKAGVTFKKRNSQQFWDLKFNKYCGVLWIPPIKINDATKTLFLNLVAYEQCHLGKFWNMYITDYVAFMDNIVNSESDVSHLYKAGIIVHQLGSDAEVADLFNRLVKKAFVDWERGQLNTYYTDLNNYCSQRRHRWCASWHNEYMKNPWVIMSIIAAFLLFAATLMQTIYTVFPYYVSQ